MEQLDAAICYVFWKHKNDGVYNAEGWDSRFPDRYMWDASDGMMHLTKLNKLLSMILYKKDAVMHDWAMTMLPGTAARSVDGMVDNHLLGVIQMFNWGGVSQEEMERAEKRKRDAEELIFIPCRDYPNCRKSKRCEYIHTDA